jgi:menaquinone-dependent protoporphyrinogen oxidase
MESKILVAYASKYGATKEIADRIGKTLSQSGLAAEVLPAEQVKDISTYESVVLGSAAYIGNWRKGATGFIHKFDDELEKMPAWIFSSGPLEDGDALQLMKGWKYPKSLEPTIERIKPRDITVFHGAVNFQKMNLFERWMMQRFKLAKNDFRRWDLIENWANGIAESVKR